MPDESAREAMAVAWVEVRSAWDALQACPSSGAAHKELYRRWSDALTNWIAEFNRYLQATDE